MNLRIFNKDVPLHSLLFVVGEGLLIYLAVLTASFFRFGNLEDSFLSHTCLARSLLITVVCQASLYYNDLYNLRVTDTYLELGLRLMKALGIASIALALIYYLVPSAMMGRGIFFVSLFFFILFVVSWRYVYNWVLKKKMFTEKILIFGDGSLSADILEGIGQRRDSGYQVAGIISQNSSRAPEFPEDIPVYKHDEHLCELAESLAIDKIVVAMDERRGCFPTRELLRCRMNGIQVLEGETLYEELTGKILVEKINPSWLIFSDGFRKTGLSRFSKRLVGLVMSSIGLLLASPLIGVIALAIKLDSRGPVIYRQLRCGQDGRPFELCKFRSMVADAEAGRGPTWAVANDSRVTRVGRVLRKYRLDEIPQMWNVLKGDMSFVGPRPERPEFVEELQKQIPYYSERHTVKPGITGWAQINYPYGASVEDALEKLKYDLFYIKNMSLLLDLLIIFQTIKIVLSRRGAR